MILKQGVVEDIDFGGIGFGRAREEVRLVLGVRWRGKSWTDESRQE